jgi:hypothetical protein
MSKHLCCLVAFALIAGCATTHHPQAGALRVSCESPAPVHADGNRVEAVFARGDFHPHIPLASWVEKTYGSGAPVDVGQETWSVFRISGENAWIAFIPDESQGEYAAFVEYLVLDFPPAGVRDPPTIDIDVPTLAGYALGARFNTTSPPTSFVDTGFTRVAGVEVQRFESSPSADDSMTFRRIFVRNGLVAGMSVVVTE